MISLKKGIVALVITTLFQVHYLDGKEMIHSSFQFLDGVPVYGNEWMKVSYLFAWFIPIVVMSFYFSGWFTDYLSKYGIYTLMRGEDRIHFFVLRYLKLILVLLAFVAVQFATMVIFNLVMSEAIVEPQIELIFMYFMTLLVIFTFQIILDLFVPDQVSLMTTNLALVMLAYLPFQEMGWGSYLFIPSYGMGFRTGLTSVSEFSTNLISIPIAFIFSLMILLGLMMIGFKRIKKIDIF